MDHLLSYAVMFKVAGPFPPRAPSAGFTGVDRASSYEDGLCLQAEAYESILGVRTNVRKKAWDELPEMIEPPSNARPHAISRLRAGIRP
ncbi:MAG: hypothetical protein ACI9WU_003983 [Myxococcota bacterium]|jgi:hypothetical protein